MATNITCSRCKHQVAATGEMATGWVFCRKASTPHERATANSKHYPRDCIRYEAMPEVTAKPAKTDAEELATLW